MSSKALVHVGQDGHVARLRLNRPQKRNALNTAMANALSAAFISCDANPEIRVIVLEGSGGAFSAGADMTEALSAFEAGEKGYNPAARTAARVAASPKPVIASIDGPAFGGGAVLACSTDIRILTARSSLRFPGAAYGLVVGGVALPRLVGNARAKELLFTARVVDAEEAERIGLANQVVADPEALETRVTELARMIAQASPTALGWMKQIVNAATSGEHAYALEEQADLHLRGGPDHLERFRDATRRVTGRAGDS